MARTERPESESITRREFVSRTARVGVGLALAGGAASCSGGDGGEGSGQGRGRGGSVVGVCSGPGAMGPNLRPDPGAVESILDQAVSAAFGVEAPGEVWASLFEAGDVVGLKVNALAGPLLSSARALTEAVVKRLRLAGVGADSIIVFDRSDRELRSAGFEVRASGGEYLCFGTDRQGVGYDDFITMAGESGSRVSRIASTFCNKLINIPVIKDHDISGISAALKNYFGVIHNPNKCHLNGCSPYVADVYSFPQLGPKTALVVADGLLCQYEAGPAYKPQFAWPAGLVMVSTDPVAVDALCAELIDAKRRENGLPTLAEAGRPVRYLAPAAAYGLGEADLGAVTVVRREL